jgi:cytochrome bd-type quinol oxidase subunit 1
MVCVGTMLSSFWILCNNSWMQVPVGYVIDGKLVPTNWWAVIAGPIVRARWPHMLLAAFLTTGMTVIAAGVWYLLRGRQPNEARIMLHWGIGLVAVIVPLQMLFGHLTGEYVLHYQPAKFAAIEARWKTQQPASEVLIAIPDPLTERNLLAIEVPNLGSFIASGTWDAKDIGLDDFPLEDRPAGGHPILRVPHDGRHGPDHAGGFLVQGLARLVWPIGQYALVPLGGIPVVSERICRRALRLIHGGGRSPAVGGVRPFAHQ